MNLFEFFENWYPNTSIVIETNNGEIFNGLAKDTPSELQHKYWIKAGQVFYLMEHSKDSLNAKIQLMNQFSFSKFQAQAIIDMRVRLFSEDEKEKIENELQDLLEQINCFPEL